MSFQGNIENGVVVFDEPVSIPEGTAVRVETLAAPRKTLAERFKNVIDLFPYSPWEVCQVLHECRQDKDGPIHLRFLSLA